MTKCCDTPKGSPLETLGAGLSSLPRQLATFPEVRQRLLERLADPDDFDRQASLGNWRPSGDDFGLMSLEMWAYVADVLSFYDERIANETYIETAVRRPSLRRIVQLLGYTPRGGIAATATLAAIAEGRISVNLPAGTGFRSRGFDGEPPQVFETASEGTIHPLWNQWTVSPFRRRPTVDASFLWGNGETSAEEATKSKDKSDTELNLVNRLLFDPKGFGLAADEPVLIEARDAIESDFTSQAGLVTGSEPFAGQDGKSYTRVTLKAPIAIATDVDLSTLRARRPTQTASATANEPIGPNSSTPDPIENDGSSAKFYLDLPPSAFRLGATVIVARNHGGDEPIYRIHEITGIEAAAVRVTAIPEETFVDPNDTSNTITVPQPTLTASLLTISPSLPTSFLNEPTSVTLHHAMVNGGTLTNTCKLSITADELSDAEGVPIGDAVDLPLDGTQSPASYLAAQGVIEQDFLLADADEVGLKLNGRLTVSADGRGVFRALDREQILVDKLRLPLTIYGNLVETSRGESIYNEVLGSGDPRTSNQQFQLKKKPLTYVHQASGDADATAQSTLLVRVDGIEWQEVGSFYGCGPQDQVYTVHHDDKDNTIITFGDGVRGARLSAGVGNVAADYQHGAGAAAPPANHIKQLASAVKGLRSVKSPIAAIPGKDPDSAEHLRTNAPSVALMLGRAVSAADFEALANDAPGVVLARAQWLWIPEQMQAGIVVHYIGDAEEATIRDTLRARSDPTIPIEVTKAIAIIATVSVSIETDPLMVKETVAANVHDHLIQGILAPEQASIGGTFWPSDINQAAGEVSGVIAVNGLSFTTDSESLVLSAVHGTCIESGYYLDFSGDGAVTVTAVAATGLPPATGK